MNSVPTSQETWCISIAKTNWLMLYTKIITAYSKNHSVCIMQSFFMSKQVVCIETTVISKLERSWGATIYELIDSTVLYKECFS